MNSFFRFSSIIYIFFCLTFLACNSSENSTDEDDPNVSNNTFDTQSSLHFNEGLSILNQNGEKILIDGNGNSPKGLAHDNIVKNVGAEISSLDHFHDGLAVILIKKKDGGLEWGYINKKGKNPFKKSFSYAGEFENGSAIIKEDNGWGLIDKKGNYLVPAKYEGVSHLINKNMWIKEGPEWSYVSYPKMTPVLEGTYLIYGEDYEGTFWIDKASDDPEKVLRAYANNKGKIISPWFSNATNFSEELAAFEQNDKWGFIDKNGKIVIPPSFDYASNFSEGMARFTTVTDNEFGDWGYINKTGEIIIPMQFKFAADFKNGIAEVKDNDGKCGFINTRGEVIIDYQFESSYQFHEGLAAVKTAKKWGFINKIGKVVIPFQFDKIPTFVDAPFDGGFSGGAAKVDIDGYDFFIDKAGNCMMGCLE
jgi:hypothetical protein